jgi:hypothetical protein
MLHDTGIGKQPKKGEMGHAAECDGIPRLVVPVVEGASVMLVVSRCEWNPDISVQ